jgi:hypothetical protein
MSVDEGFLKKVGFFAAFFVLVGIAVVWAVADAMA